MDKIRVLVVDDNSFAREVIIGLLSEDEDIVVIGEAENGKEAITKVGTLKPHIVIMDVNMPEMNGLEATEQIMIKHAVPILIVTSRADADTAYNAISKGALEIIPKPDLDLDNPRTFINEVKLLSNVKVISHLSKWKMTPKEKNVSQPHVSLASEDDRIIAIAASTGGPKALSIILAELPAEFPCPIVIAQHISQDFVGGMTEWLNNITRLTVKEGQNGEALSPGTVYISPAYRNMTITPLKKIDLKAKAATDLYSPSCNLLVVSAAQAYQKKCIGIELTGMGDDGVAGMLEIKKQGGITLAQDEQTSAVFGMPKAAIEKGCIDKILPIHKMASHLMQLITPETDSDA